MGNRTTVDVLQKALRELYSHLDLDTLPRVAIDVATRLVDADVTGYNEIDPARRRGVGVLLPEAEGAALMQNIGVWEKFMHQHPLLNHFKEFPYDRPRKITDFMTQRAFEELDLYREFFGPRGFRYQMVTNIPTRSSIVAGIAQNRRGRDFSERDRQALDLLRPHFRQAYENASLVSELRSSTSRLELLMDRMDRGQIVIEVDGSVVMASPAAVRFVGEFLPKERLTTTALPATLADWSRREIAALGQNASDLLEPLPLLIDGESGRLAARLIADQQPTRFIVVLSRVSRPASPEALLSMGLTAREADVLFWSAEGKTRSETATILHISERTVQKHLEHIYAKLDVTNRVAAVTKALEWTRW